MKYLLLVLLCSLSLSCQKKEAPPEIVRVVPGKSLLEQVSPTLQRNKKNNTRVLLIQDSLSERQLDSHLLDSSRLQKKTQYEPLYISGKKAEEKKRIQQKIQEKIKESQTKVDP